MYKYKSDLSLIISEFLKIIKNHLLIKNCLNFKIKPINKIVFIILILFITKMEFLALNAGNKDKFWEDFIRLRESKFGKDKKYLNKLSDCRMIADNFLKIKKEEDNFNKRVWAVSNCMKDYEKIMEVKKMIK